MMKALIMLSSKGLLDQLTPSEDPPLVRAVMNSFFEACLVLSRMDTLPDLERFYTAWIRSTYAYVAICGEAGDLVDHTTGCVIPSAIGTVYRSDDEYENWYMRYAEILAGLNFYYRSDVIAAIRMISEFGSVRSVHYINHNAYQIATEINYVQLLTHDTGGATQS